jgi:hypothetical protein
MAGFAGGKFAASNTHTRRPGTGLQSAVTGRRALGSRPERPLPFQTNKGMPFKKNRERNQEVLIKFIAYAFH